MVRFEVKENSRWNANIVGLFVIVDGFEGVVVVDGFMNRQSAAFVCDVLNSGSEL